MSVLHVWLAPEALVDDPGARATLDAVLSDDERARLDEYRADGARRLALLARGLLRLMLSRAHSLAPRAWCFERTAAGRPAVSARHALDLDFNLSHTRGLVVLAAGRAMQVGVDVERIEHRRPLDIARRYFSAREVAALEALPERERPRRFIELWTLKEAYLKAVGSGIAGGLATASFDWHDGELRFERDSDPHAAQWRFRQWTWRDEHQLALAWLAPGEPKVQCREVTVADLVGAESGQEQGAEAEQRREADAVGEGRQDDAG